MDSFIFLAFLTGAVRAASCPGYRASNIVKTTGVLAADLTLSGNACNVYGQDIIDLRLLVEYQTNTRLHVKIYDAALDVYQVQEHIIPRPASQNVSESDAALQFSFEEEPFSFIVSRSDTREVVFNTTGQELIFESQYLHVQTALPSNPNLYGLGEHSDPFRLPTERYRRTLWNAESPFIPRNSNLYGSHPVYLEHRGSSGSHGVFLLNSNGMDINIYKEAEGQQYLKYETVGGVLDFYFLAGPSPLEVSKQYAEVIGLPAMMPYWTFGFHQCKYGYWDVNMAAEVVANYSAAEIPLETLWGDIDYMNLRQDFTTDPERFPLHKMRELVQTLHQRSQQYIMMVDPGIHRAQNYSTFLNGEESEVFLKSDDGSNYLGGQWAGEVVWPDWLAPNTQKWWRNEFATFFDPDRGIDVDGVWNDMNEASNFCPNVTCNTTQFDDPSVFPIAPTTPPRNNTGRPIPGFPADFQPENGSDNKLGRRQSTNGMMKGLRDRDLFNPQFTINNHRGAMSDGTIYTNISNADGTVQYDTHNLYGVTMVMASRQAMLARRPQARPFVLTRSTFAGAGTHAAHWFGDNNSTWADYRVSIAQLLGFSSIHQMPMAGSDVCGFNGVADEKMCSRWAMLGAFMPFYRNHAVIDAPFQEFYVWPNVTRAAQKAIAARYRLLDYIYTAMYRASTTGSPIVNPLFFIYPSDQNTFGIDTQFFYGDALLVSPVVEDYSQSVSFYLPDDVFYDFWTLEQIQGTGANRTLDNVDWNDIPVYIRGSTILPLRIESANTTKILRQNDFNIIVAPGKDGKAAGSLYLDDGESLEVENSYSDIRFSWDSKTFTASGNFGFATSLIVKTVTILGEGGPITQQGPWSLSGQFEFTLS
ncbi:hypothetical protein JX265_007312 [Neoarthrinium moseri]|uniref:alpha-glucosidase n=1 Tax=Neoarthrinium moseri TaxID=1658444 RepID=A0A9P9WK12_9PEZI|nr:hypothetical protein JX265_007312 [Neoarthrinium moseri]